MTIVFGFFASSRSNEGVQRLAQCIRDEGTDETVLEMPGFAVRVRSVVKGAEDRILAVTNEGVSIAIIGRPLLRRGELLNIAPVSWNDLASALRKLDGYWVALAFDDKNHRLKVLCDTLGVGWLYWTRTRGGVAFSSDFGALARSLERAPQVDDQACLLSLTITYPLGDATCFEGIRLLSPASALVFDGENVSREPLPLLSYGDDWVGMSREAKFEVLEAALDDSYDVWSSSRPGTGWAVALSSGKDSRYSLGLLLKHNERPACATFGLPGSTDVNGAIATCRQERLQHRVYHPSLSTSWESWKTAIQRLGVVAGYQYAGGWGHDWRRTLASLDGQVVLGFLGDALSGLHLVDRFKGDWIANWEAWSLDENDDGSWTGSQMIRSVVRREARATIRASMLKECENLDAALDHQLAFHLDLFSRQRRATASQINFLTDEIAVAPLLYTRKMIQFWGNLAYEDLREQSLYLDFAQNRLPRLFPPPRRPSLIERGKGTLANLAVDLWPALRSRVKPPEIDTRAIVARHLDDLKMLVRNYGDAVSHIVDLSALLAWLDRFNEDRGPQAGGLQRFWNLMLLMDAGLGKASGDVTESARTSKATGKESL